MPHQMWVPAPLPTKHQPQAHNLQKQAIANLFPNVCDRRLLNGYEVSHRRRYPTKFSSSPLNPKPANRSASTAPMNPELAVPQQIIHLANCHVKNPSETFVLLCNLGPTPSIVNIRQGWQGRLDLKVMRNAEAFAMTAMGEVLEGGDRCEQCIQGEGPFARCVVVSGYEKGACGSCVYGSGDGNLKCSLWFGKGFKPKKKTKDERESRRKLDTTAIEEAVARGFAQRFNNDGPPPKFPPELTRLTWAEFLERGVILQKTFDRVEREVMEREAQDKITGNKFNKLNEMSNRQLFTTWDSLSKELIDWKRVKSAKHLRLWEGYYRPEHKDGESEEENAEYEEVGHTNEVTKAKEDVTDDKAAEKTDEKEGNTVNTKAEETKAIKNIMGWISQRIEQQGNAEEETTDAEVQSQQSHSENGKLSPNYPENTQYTTEAEFSEAEFGETAALIGDTQPTTIHDSPMGDTDTREQQQYENPWQNSTETGQFDDDLDGAFLSDEEFEELYEKHSKIHTQGGKRNKTPPYGDEGDDSELRQSKKSKSSAE